MEATLRNEVKSQPRPEARLQPQTSESSYGDTEYHAAIGTELRVGTAVTVDKASSSRTV